MSEGNVTHDEELWVTAQLALCDEFLQAAENDETFGVEDIRAKREQLAAS